MPGSVSSFEVEKPSTGASSLFRDRIRRVLAGIYADREAAPVLPREYRCSQGAAFHFGLNQYTLQEALTRNDLSGTYRTRDASHRVAHVHHVHFFCLFSFPLRLFPSPFCLTAPFSAIIHKGGGWPDMGLGMGFIGLHAGRNNAANDGRRMEAERSYCAKDSELGQPDPPGMTKGQSVECRRSYGGLFRGESR